MHHDRKNNDSDKEPTKLDASFIPEKSSTGKDIEETKSKPHQRSKIHRAVKLPRLKLEDLVSQVTEEMHIGSYPLDKVELS